MLARIPSKPGDVVPVGEGGEVSLVNDTDVAGGAGVAGATVICVVCMAGVGCVVGIMVIWDVGVCVVVLA